jgi:hypothetical protein
VQQLAAAIDSAGTSASSADLIRAVSGLRRQATIHFHPRLIVNRCPSRTRITA